MALFQPTYTDKKILPAVFAVSTVTPAGLLSGTSAKNCSKEATGGLLREIGERGFVVLKDFTSILSQSREVQKATLAASALTKNDPQLLKIERPIRNGPVLVRKP
jgi:hypothetical protein